MKTSTFIIIVIVVVLLAVILLNFDKVKAALSNQVVKQGIPGTTGANGQPVGSLTLAGNVGVTATSLNGAKVLKMGVTGPEVKELQTIMNTVDPSGNLATDGVFGQLTQAELEKLTGAYQITLNQAWSTILGQMRNLFTTIPASSNNNNNNSNANNSTSTGDGSLWDVVVGAFN